MRGPKSRGQCQHRSTCNNADRMISSLPSSLPWVALTVHGSRSNGPSLILVRQMPKAHHHTVRVIDNLRRVQPKACRLCGNISHRQAMRQDHHLPDRLLGGYLRYLSLLKHLSSARGRLRPGSQRRSHGQRSRNHKNHQHTSSKTALAHCSMATEDQSRRLRHPRRVKKRSRPRCLTSIVQLLSRHLCSTNATKQSTSIWVKLPYPVRRLCHQCRSSNQVPACLH
jgi:hypothetical protein